MELERLPIESGFRIALTVPPPFFEPMAFYPRTVDDNGVMRIDIVDFEIDDYWDLIDDDPAD